MHSIKHGAFQTAVDQIRTLHVVVEISGLLNQDPDNQGKSECTPEFFYIEFSDRA